MTDIAHVRAAHETDLQAILDIYNDAVLHTNATADYTPRSLDDRRAWFHDRTSAHYPILVAEIPDGEVIGWASLGPYHARIGYRHTAENSVYIAEEYRGKGVGKLLLTELLKKAVETPLELHAIIASIDSENNASIALHSQFGFEHCGRFPQIVTKFGKWLDVVYMVKHIS